MPAASPAKRAFFSLSVQFGGLCDIVVLLSLAGTWIGFLGSLWWFFDLFDHFRLQYLAVSFAALAWFLVRRKWRLAVLALLALGANGWPIAGTTLQDSQSAPSIHTDRSRSIKLVCFNVLFANKQVSQIRDYLMAQDADVIGLLEFPPQLEAALEPLTQTHPHGIRCSDDSPWGIALYSRIPIEGAKLRTYGTEEPLSIEATAKVGDQSVLVILTHPWPPSSHRARLNQQTQLEGIASRAKDHGAGPVIVMGDFNATPWCNAMRTLLDSGPRLKFAPDAAPWVPTWNVHSALMLPIDQVLCSSGLVFQRREIGPDLGSDHRPQVLEIALH